jgi:uncharacterized membrane protein (Fun14 family)
MMLHSLARPQRLLKEVGSFKTISKVLNYLLAEALKICLKLVGLEFMYVLELSKKSLHFHLVLKP